MLNKRFYQNSHVVSIISFILALCSLSLSTYQVLKIQPSTTKYVDTNHVMKALESHVNKLLSSMYAKNIEEINVLQEEIKSLEEQQSQDKELKNYVLPKTKKALKEKKEKLEQLSKTLNAELRRQRQICMRTKLDELKRHTTEAGKRYKCNIVPTIELYLVPHISKKYDITDEIIKKVGLDQEKDSPKQKD